MTGRDPDEAHRAATPLELLYDLTFVVAFGTAADELAHAYAAGHLGTGLASFALCVFAICLAWINFSWFSSAYDNDDWAFRLLTMAQMVGVLILALGITDVFRSMEAGAPLDVGVVMAGYVVMRIPMVGLWLRCARHDPDRRPCANLYVRTIVVSQVLWCLLAVPHLQARTWFALASIPIAIELIGPTRAERVGHTPWHPHHIAERYSLLAIITLGEAILGTVAAISALVHDRDAGWTTDAVAVLAAGIALTFGMWWSYFVLPWGEVLARHRDRGWFWGYGHVVVFGAIAATGAGLHSVQFLLDGHSELGPTRTLLAVALPVAAYTGMLYLMYAVSVRTADPFHLLLLAATGAVLLLAVVLSALGASIATCLVVVALAPVATVVGYETVGHRHVVAHLER
jgi:low temperature requirement protein LtrA